jgi:ssDNA-specific exonuclease RecJ
MQNPNMNFEYEYWGLTYLEGLNKILEIDKSNPIVIYRQPTSPIPGTLRIMDQKKRERIWFSEELEDSKYFIDNYHSYFNNQSNFRKFYNLKAKQEIFSINRNGIKLLSIFKLDSTNKVNHELNIPLLNIIGAKPY